MSNSRSFFRFSSFIRFTYACSQALSTGASFIGTIKNRTGVMLAGGIAAALSGINAYCFQGKKIKENMEEHAEEGEAENSVDYGSADRTPAPAESSYTAMAAQFIYSSLDLTKTYMERHFILESVFLLFNANPASPLFWSYLALGIFTKEIFSMTNELYETLEEVGEVAGNDPHTPPFYAKLFSCFRSNKTREFLRGVGSVEHTVNDDLLPWLALFTKDSIEFLRTHLKLGIPVLSLFSLAILILGPIIYKQTYLFEGNHTVENLKKMNPHPERTPLETSPGISVAQAETLMPLLNIMGPVHGLADAVPVILAVRNEIKDPTMKILASSLLGFFTFLGSAKGIHESEVFEGKVELKKIKERAAEEEKHYNSINDRRAPPISRP